MSTMHTASVWGQGRAALSLSSMAGKVKDGDEECMICRDDVPACVSFQPCSHAVCFGCVENMRAKNIFKADKGVKCPFCRAYIDGYRSLMGADPTVMAFLDNANKAASTAAQARAIMERKKAAADRAALADGRAAYSGGTNRGAGPSSCSYSSSVSSADERWNCNGCGGTNYVWREFCSRCRRPNPAPPAALGFTKKDVLKLSPDEIVALVRDKGGLSLARPLLDMGVNVDAFKITCSTASVVEAIQTNGLDRILRVYSALADPERLKEAALSLNGNFGVQRLLEAGAKLRAAMHGHAAQLKAASVQLVQFRKDHGGRDPFAALLRAMLPHMLEYCGHDKGVYVVQCAAHHCASSELLVLAQNIFPLGIPVSKDPKGIFVLLGVFEILEQRIWSDPHTCELLLAEADKLCGLFVSNTRQLLFTAMHGLSGKMLMRAAALALPRWQATRMVSRLASLAGSMVEGDAKGGVQTLQELLLLYGHNEETSLLLRDACCMVAYQLSGKIGQYALSDNAEQRELVRLLILRMAYEQEMAWLDAIIQELVGVVDALVARPASQELLELALTQDVLRIDLDAVADHLADVKSVIGKAGVQPIVGRIMAALQDGGDAPKPRYFAPSVLQPELRYYVEVVGVPLPLPPPPPPKGATAPKPAAGGAAAPAPVAAAAPVGAAARPAAAAGASVPVPVPVPQPAVAPAAPAVPVPVPQPVAAPRVPVPVPQPAGVPVPVPVPQPASTPTVTVAFQPQSSGGAPAPAAAAAPSALPPHLQAAAIAARPAAAAPAMTGYELQRQRAAAAAAAARTPQAAVPATAQVAYGYQPYGGAQQQPQQQPQQQQQQQWAQQQAPRPAAAQPVYQQYAQQQQPQLQQQQYGQPQPYAQPQQYAQQQPQYAQPQQQQQRYPAQGYPQPQQQQQQQQQQPRPQQQYAQPPQQYAQPRYNAPAPAPAAPAPAPGGRPIGPWACSVCTYEHKGPESGFLACAMCGTERGE